MMIQWFRCRLCQRVLGTGESHTLVGMPFTPEAVYCQSCAHNKGRHRAHALQHPECGVEWHDFYDHPHVYVVRTRRQARAVLVEMSDRDDDDRTVVPVAELLAVQACSPSCLLAQEGPNCKCRCGGKWHGTLLALDISVSANMQGVT